MSGFFKNVTGIGLDHNELYNRAYEKGVNLNKFSDAADIFDKAAKKYAEGGNQMMATQAGANSLLYRYLATGNVSLLQPLLQLLQQLPQIEQIKLREPMPVGPLCIELDCRLVESAIAQSQNDRARSRDLHQMASEKFKALGSNPLLTYSLQKPSEGPNDRADMRQYYHTAMHSYWEAMIKKDADPGAASNDLSNAKKYFSLCNDQRWGQTVGTLLENWRISRTCWICHRDMQGSDLHFSMCHARVTPYAEMILKKANQNSSSISFEKQQIAVCTPCGSMVTFKAEVEADKVRQELSAKLAEAMNVIRSLESRVSRLERMSHSH